MGTLQSAATIAAIFSAIISFASMCLALRKAKSADHSAERADAAATEANRLRSGIEGTLKEMSATAAEQVRSAKAFALYDVRHTQYEAMRQAATEAIRDSRPPSQFSGPFAKDSRPSDSFPRDAQTLVQELHEIALEWNEATRRRDNAHNGAELDQLAPIVERLCQAFEVKWKETASALAKHVLIESSQER
jgi:hypothetical protein